MTAVTRAGGERVRIESGDSWMSARGAVGAYFARFKVS